MLPFRKILWVKAVSLDEGEMAYPGRVGQQFFLHCTPEDADSLAEPEPEDLMVLIQHDQATHLVQALAEPVHARSPRTMKKGSRDARYSMQRAFELVVIRPLEDAVLLGETFGFDPEAGGGEVLRIDELPAYDRGEQPMWMVQRRILKAFEGHSVQALFRSRFEATSDGTPDLHLEDFLRGRT